MTSIQQFIQQIFPTYNSERVSLIRSSMDEKLWFRIEPTRHLLVLPPLKNIHSNPQLLWQTVESVEAFEKMDFEAPQYNWDPDTLGIKYVNTRAEAINTLQELIQQEPKYLAIDIETQSVLWDRNQVIAIGIATFLDSAITFSGTALEPIEKWQQLFDLTETQFIWHNGQFDIGRLAHLRGIKARVDQDTMLMHYATINETKGTHGLKDLAPLYLQAPQWADELQKYKREYCRTNGIKVTDFTYDLIPIEVLLPYLAMDCIATYRLYFEFKRFANPKCIPIYQTLCKAANVYSRIEQNGIQLDLNYMDSLRDVLEKDLKEAQIELDQVVAQLWDPEQYMRETGAKSCNKGVFTHKSPKQLKWIIEKAVGHQISDTSAQTIEELGEKAPFLRALARVRKCNKYIDTYIDGYESHVDSDERIRGSYKLHGTETGRLSSETPKVCWAFA